MIVVLIRADKPKRVLRRQDVPREKMRVICWVESKARGGEGELYC